MKNYINSPVIIPPHKVPSQQAKRSPQWCAQIAISITTYPDETLNTNKFFQIVISSAKRTYTMDSDHFGLGSAIFEIFMGSERFQEFTEAEVSFLQPTG